MVKVRQANENNTQMTVDSFLNVSQHPISQVFLYFFLFEITGIYFSLVGWGDHLKYIWKMTQILIKYVLK